MYLYPKVTPSGICVLGKVLDCSLRGPCGLAAFFESGELALPLRVFGLGWDCGWVCLWEMSIQETSHGVEIPGDEETAGTHA